jgi:hypothetical protein
VPDAGQSVCFAVTSGWRRRKSSKLLTERIAGCLREAQRQGELSPRTDPEQLAQLLVDCWEGAAVRMRLRRDPAPLEAMLDFYFRAAAEVSEARTRRG